MKKRWFITAGLMVCLMVPGGPARGRETLKREPMKKFTIYMVLWRGVTDAEKGFMDWFKDYPTARNITVDFVVRDCGKDTAVLDRVKDEIRMKKPDLVYAFGTTVTQRLAGTVKDAPSPADIADIPMVFNIVAYPEAAGLVSSKASKSNLTGVSHLVPLAAQYNAMKSVCPLNRIGIIYNPEEGNAVAVVKELERFAQSRSFELVKAPVKTGKDKKPRVESIPPAVMSLIRKSPQFIYLPSDSFIISNAGMITEITDRHRIPTFSATEEPIRKSGAFMGLVSLYYNAGRFAGYKAEQILVGKKKPGDIPVETLERFSLLINIDAGKKIEQYPPLTMLKYAEIIHDGRKN
jgi:putative ABC transport system substrate-binding protein